MMDYILIITFLEGFHLIIFFFSRPPNQIAFDTVLRQSLLHKFQWEKNTSRFPQQLSRKDREMKHKYGRRVAKQKKKRKSK